MYSHRKPSADLAPQKPTRLAKTLKYTDKQEHLLRRLGSALVLHWDAIPDELQDLLIDQAAHVEDRGDAAHESHDVEHFIRSAKTTALKARVSAN